MGLRKLKHAELEAPVISARAAGLTYVTDAAPGIRRLRSGKGFRYVTAQGRPLRAATDLERIRKLVIPPAWTQVWICPNPCGHLQATGRDARGRKQYRYHAQWRVVRDESKYGNMLAFGSALPSLRSKVSSDLSAPGLGRDKVLAAIVQLLEKTLIRVGNDEYVRANGSFGLTTLRDGHVAISGATLRFRFKGKSGKEHDIAFHDRRLARVVRQCRDLPGQRLFRFVGDDGVMHDIGSGDVNDYVRTVTGSGFTAKDFRTWTGTVLAARALQELPPYRTKAEATKNVKKAVEAVAGLLGNTPAVCRKSYIHPAVVEGYFDGRLARSSFARVGKNGQREDDLSKTESTVLKLLRRPKSSSKSP